MSFSTPDDFARQFAQAWGARDVAALVSLFSEDADLLTLTGAWAEGREEIGNVLSGELAGAFARAKLVTGKAKVRAIGPQAAVVMQRFVLSGIRNADGSDAGRIGTVLSAVVAPGGDGWQVRQATFSVES
ncbi:SgcJ/EcaC family oxidoreductase [Frigidibacter sp. MR17.14]|uniref:YybH family protein n=1 Tax=Frigidibacter sp. MR17.14 TaxID=3126509 RepID=UPI003012BB36